MTIILSPISWGNTSATDLKHIVESFYGVDSVISAPPRSDGKSNVLDLVSSGGGNATAYLYPGWAVVAGALYNNDWIIPFSFPATTVGARVDTIVLETNTVGRTVTAKRVQGTEAAQPFPPSLASNQFPLWNVFLPAGHTGTSVIQNVYIHDRREFYIPSPWAGEFTTENLAYNADFMAWGNSSQLPEGWRTFSGSSPSIGKGIDDPASLRGVALYANIPANSSIELISDAGTNVLTDTWGAYYTARLKLGIASNQTVTISLLNGWDRTNEVVIATKTYGYSTITEPILIRGLVAANLYNLPRTIKIRISTGSSSAFVSLTAPLQLVRGLVTGGDDPRHEILFFRANRTDSSWSLTNKADGSYLIDLNTNFQGELRPGVRAVFGLASARDSNSIASVTGDTGITIRSIEASELITKVNLEGLANNSIRAKSFIISTTEHSTFGFRVFAEASGTLQATLVLTGIVT